MNTINIPVSRLHLIPLLTGSLLMTGGVELTSSAIAQEYPGCFIREPDGEVTNITQSVCQLFPSSQEPTAATSTGVYRVPIKRREAGIPVVDVSFGDKTFEMLVDTGASGIAITPQMAEALGVQAYGVLPFSTPSDRLSNQQVGRMPSISVGGLVVKDVEVAITPALDIGLLGQGFFRNYDVSISQDFVEFRARS